MSIVPHYNAPKPIDPALEDAMRAAVLGLLGELIEASKMRAHRTIELDDLERIAKRYKPIDRSPPKPPTPPRVEPEVPRIRAIAEAFGLPHRRAKEADALVAAISDRLRVEAHPRMIPIIDFAVALLRAELANPSTAIAVALKRTCNALVGPCPMPPVREGSPFELSPSERAFTLRAVTPQAFANGMAPPPWQLELAQALGITGAAHAKAIDDERRSNPPAPLSKVVRVEACRLVIEVELVTQADRDAAVARYAGPFGDRGHWTEHDEMGNAIDRAYQARRASAEASAIALRERPSAERLGAAIAVAEVLDATARDLGASAPTSLAFLLVNMLRESWDAGAPRLEVKLNPNEIVGTLRYLGVKFATGAAS